MAAFAARLDGDAPRAVIACRRPAAFAAALLAVWRAGGRVLLPANLQPGRIDEYARTEGAVVLADADAASLPDRSGGIVSPAPLPDLADGAVVAEVFTSGSTGRSRRAPKTAGQLLGEARSLAEAFAGERLHGPVLATVPPHHIYGLLFGVLVPLTAGLTFVDATPLHPEAVALALAGSGARTLVSTPTHLRSLEILDAGEIPAGVHVFSSAGPLPAATARMLHERFGLEVTEVFGSTETGGIAHRTTRGGVLPDRFEPLPGVAVEVRDGRLWLVASPFLPPDAPRPHPCDDRAEPCPGGGFRHLGRLDDVVKVAGKRISVRELEAALAAVDGVTDAAVLAEPAVDGRGVRIRAAVVAPGHTSASLRAALSDRFDPTCLPRAFRFVPRLPRTAAGKLPRARLAELFERPADPIRLDPAGREGGGFRYEATIPADLPDFDGHFPGDPVLPAISQVLHLVLPAVRASFPHLGRLESVARLKFKAKIVPGDRVAVVVEERRPGRVRFAIERRDEVGTVGMARFSTTAAADGT